ncbi:MAG TPA: hypothetical protein ENJ63_00375 [Dissulfuribacter thermophilus]|uniref:Uncharacterized protein n=1 Tax=Dissulfuribacter thermophilus TaxID=1156395 RepID=A0A7V2WSQ1_9BACT|nr:hypothetical protein [Dissulfuribacter thermophilus]
MVQRVFIFCFLFQLVVGSAYSMSPSEGKRLFELLGEIKGQLQQIDKRFEQIDKRFEQVDKRFEQVDKRITELKEDMNRRFEEMREDTNKRFEQVDKRMEAQLSFLWMLTGIFSSITAAVIALLIWDRRTAVKHALKESEDQLEAKYGLSLLRKVVMVLQEKAKSDSELALILKKMGIL